jgi:NADH-quinone oxidoreductase subunit E
MFGTLVGRHHISVCKSRTCFAAARAARTSAPAESGEARQTGVSSSEEEECLAACNGAPMMMVDHVYYENLTPEGVDRVLEAHK